MQSQSAKLTCTVEYTDLEKPKGKARLSFMDEGKTESFFHVWELVKK